MVLFFYPLDFTFVCPTEIIAFNDRVAEFEKINTQVIAASVDSKFTHLAWIKTPRNQGEINSPYIGIFLIWVMGILLSPQSHLGVLGFRVVRKLCN